MSTPKIDVVLSTKAVERSNVDIGTTRYNPALKTFEEWSGTSWDAVSGGGGGGTTGANLHMTGEWTTGKSYVNSDTQIDVVSNNGSSYGALVSHTSSASNEPPNATYWGLIAAKGEKGDTGPKGDTGNTGATGEAATIRIGTTTTGEPGSSASVTNSGTTHAAVFNFVIPEGEQGPAGQELRLDGAWAVGNSYVHSDTMISVVQYSGSSYMAKSTHTSTTGNQPPNATYWQLLAERGEQGPSGAVATSTTAGAVRPDNTTITIDTSGNGIISAKAMSGATASAAGSAGIVPAPAAGYNYAFFRGDGTWQSNLVTTNTTQDITGQKTFTSNIGLTRSSPFFILQNTDLVKGTTPSTNLASLVVMQDSTSRTAMSARLGAVYTEYRTDNSIRTGIQSLLPVSGSSTVGASLYVQTNSDGTYSSYCHTPSVTDNSTSIATTAFVRSAIAQYAPTPDLSAYAPLASPALTGTPTAPTAATTTNSTQIATTAFVKAAIGSYAPLASPTFTGTPKAPTATAGTNTTQIATTAFVTTAVSAKANLASPAFTGTPTAPTATSSTNNTQIATTAFVRSAITAYAATTSDLASYMPKSGGTFTGTVSGVTPTYTTNSTVLATTAFVYSLLNSLLGLGGATSPSYSSLNTGYPATRSGFWQCTGTATGKPPSAANAIGFGFTFIASSSYRFQFYFNVSDRCLWVRHNSYGWSIIWDASNLQSSGTLYGMLEKSVATFNIVGKIDTNFYRGDYKWGVYTHGPYVRTASSDVSSARPAYVLGCDSTDSKGACLLKLFSSF